ncbi:hypothetical protein ANN_00959 [Periplaneta americana]|uniref:Uncharacterized protein n=1 Tax=Periplaneta americana TaxID=6978 RepID=A0ABQ8TU08_PERAM|nr:hypothetical protein ANN_00959 [Periplaneta americana]
MASTWTGVEPATSSTEDQRYSYYATQTDNNEELLYFRTAPRFIQRPIKSSTGSFPGVKKMSEQVPTKPPHSSAEVKECMEFYLQAPMCLMACKMHVAPRDCEDSIVVGVMSIISWILNNECSARRKILYPKRVCRIGHIRRKYPPPSMLSQNRSSLACRVMGNKEWEQKTGLFLLKARQIRTSSVEVCDAN